MLRQLPRVGDVQIAGGDDLVGIDVGAIFVDFALKLQPVSPFSKAMLFQIRFCGYKIPEGNLGKMKFCLSSAVV